MLWHKPVVICFQILSLTTFLQLLMNFLHQQSSCDLLSNFIFDNVLTIVLLSLKMRLSCDLLSNFIFDNVLTISSGVNRCSPLLWFAFKFYLWQRSYNKFTTTKTHKTVVICFQILSLTTFLQCRLVLSV